MSNPFANLMGGSVEPKLVTKTENLEDKSPSQLKNDVNMLSATLESVFQITLNPLFESSNKCKFAIYLGETESPENVHLSLENIDEV